METQMPKMLEVPATGCNVAEHVNTRALAVATTQRCDGGWPRNHAGTSPSPHQSPASVTGAKECCPAGTLNSERCDTTRSLKRDPAQPSAPTTGGLCACAALGR